jgi:predicted CDP-diglyceride synthetase/phosphatidate cytidylyltransferase
MASQVLVLYTSLNRPAAKMLLSELRHISYMTGTCEKMTKIEFRSECYIEPMLTEIKLVPQLLVLIYNIKFYGNSVISEIKRACGRRDCGY